MQRQESRKTKNNSTTGTSAGVDSTQSAIDTMNAPDELLKHIFDNTHMQIAYLDTNFVFLKVNRAYSEACGHDPEFFIGKNHFDIYPHTENEAIFKNVLDTGVPFNITEKAFEFPDQPERGTTYWDWSLHPVKNKDGATEGVLFCLLDVTERVQARQKQEETDQKYRELVENANSIILRVTPDRQILFFNEYAQRFFGYTAGEVVGRSVLGTIVPPVDSDGRDLRAMTAEIAAHPELHGSIDNENMCKDGRRVWIHWSNRALRDRHGNVREILCVGTDMTERRNLMRAADSYRRRLQKLADRLSTTEEQERRRVATHIHDTVVQTLSLSNIRLGGVMAALEKAGMSDQQKRLEGVRQLLDQGTKECRGLMEELVPSLLYEIGLMAALRDFVKRQSLTDGTGITVNGNDEDFQLNDAQRALIFQCARELVMNALKYAGRCEISLSLSSADEYVELRVQDNGRGFNIADLQGRNHDHTDGGFGLFNIRERVELMGGDLNIESTPGQGTIATVRVPVKTAP